MAAHTRLLASTFLAAGLTLASGCNPQQSQTQQTEPQESIPRASFAIKPGVTLPYQPQNLEELNAIRTDLIILIKQKKITVDEARQVLRSQKKRLGLPNPDQTNGFDQLLRNEHLISL